MILRLAWRNVWRNKRRSLITMAMVFMAVILSVAMQSIQEGVYKRIIDNVVTYHTGYIQVADTLHWEEGSLDDAVNPMAVEEQFQDPEIKGWVHRVENGALVAKDSNTQVAIVIGTDPVSENQLTSLKNRIIKGAYFKSSGNGLLLAEGLAEKLGVTVGDSLVLISQGYRSTSASGRFPIVATASFGSPELNTKMIYMPLKRAQTFYSLGNLVTKSAVVVDEREYESVYQRLKLDAKGTALGVRDWKEMMPELVSSLELDETGGIFMRGILYFIITFGIFGTVLMMLQERKREFGVLSAIGMKKHKLGIILVVELVIIAFLGAFGGMIGAIPVILILHYYPIRLTGGLAEAYESYGFEPVLQAGIFPDVFINNGWIVFIIAALLSVYPMWVLIRMKTINNLRS